MTRTDRRRFPILLAALALLFSPVQAQESETLLSNAGQTSGPAANVALNYFSQGFITGSNAGGYVLSSIELDVATAPGTLSAVTVELWSSVALTDINGGTPDDPSPYARAATLFHSTGTWTTGLNTFNAAANTELDPNTTYFVFVAHTSGSLHTEITSTASSSADAGSASGWSVTQRFTRTRDAAVWHTTQHYLKFKVNGRALLNRPSEIYAYWTDSETEGGSNLQGDCASSEPFRAYWLPPVKSRRTTSSGGVPSTVITYKVADEWEAEITPKRGASGVRHTIRNTNGDPEYPELTGSVRINEYSSLSIRVRGRFGDDGWGAWSPRTGMYCNYQSSEASSSEASSAASALEARFVSPPAQHDGETAFTFRIVFSEAVSATPEAMRTRVLTVAGGAVTGAARVAGASGVWTITVTPGTREALSIFLPPTADCAADGAVCTSDGRALSIGTAHIVIGPGPESQTQEEQALTASVSEGDTDLPNDNSTPGRVAVGGSATGAIGTPGDQDRFAVELEAGRTYRFDLTGSPGGGGTLPDTYFRAIYDSQGRYQSGSYNDDSDGRRDSRVTFTAPESGTYYARVSGDRDETGTYTLSVTDVTPEDEEERPAGQDTGQSVSEGDKDLPNDNATHGRVAVGGSATGAIGTAGDQDRFAVELVTGRTYRFDLRGSPGGGGTLPDTYFRAIYDSEGRYQSDSYNDDFDGGRDSRVTFRPTESGTYYARVSGDRNETGTYTLSVDDITGPASKPAVADGPPGLAPNVPNPFNPSTVIPYRLDTDGPVRLDIYNLLGQRIRTLVDKVQAVGAYRVRWDARDGRGGAVATGVYFIRLHYPGSVQIRRMLYLK